MLFGWFGSLASDAPVWNLMMFTDYRSWLLEGDSAHHFLETLLTNPPVGPLLLSGPA